MACESKCGKSDAYAYLSFVTAWLKNYYPIEFMAALMSSRDGAREDSGAFRNVAYAKEANRMGIAVKGPQLGVSKDTWTPIYYDEPQDGLIGELRQSLLSIVGVTEKTYNSIKKMNFVNVKNMNDFMNRIEHYKKEGFYTPSGSILMSYENKEYDEYKILSLIKGEIFIGKFDKINENREEVWEEFIYSHADVDSSGELYYSPNKRKAKITLNKTSIVGLIKSGALDFISTDRVALLKEFYLIKKEPDQVEKLPKSMSKETIIQFEEESLGMVISVQTRFSTIENKKVTQWTGEVEDLESWVAKSSGKKHYRFTLSSGGEKVSCLLWGYLYGRHSEAMKEGNRVTLKLEKSDDKMIVKSVSKNWTPQEELKSI